MKEHDGQLNLRVPADLRSLIRDAAKHNRRSLTAEVIARLEESFVRDGALKGSRGNALHSSDPETREMIVAMEMLLNQVDLMRKELNGRLKGLKEIGEE